MAGTFRCANGVVSGRSRAVKPLSGVSRSQSSSLQCAVTQRRSRLQDLSPRWRGPGVLCKAMSTIDAADQVLEERLHIGPNYTSAALFFLGIATVVATLGYFIHPVLVAQAVNFFGLADNGAGVLNYMKKDITVFETSFFGFLSFLFATMIGNTFGMLYTRQTQIVQELYKEVLALECLLVECLQQVQDEAERRNIVSLLTQYVDQEIGNVADICSPFQKGSALNKLLAKTAQWKADGVDTDGIVTLIKELMSTQSSRSGASVHILSPLHWIMMWTIGFFFVANFIIFETGTPGTSSVLFEDRMIFSVLCGLSTSVLLVLHDLSDAENGNYSYREALDQRLTFIREQLSSWDVSATAPVPISLEHH